MKGKPKYAGWVIAMGALIGAIAGAMAGHMGVWLAIGVAIGLAIGMSSRHKGPECPECAAMHRVHSALEARRQS